MKLAVQVEREHHDAEMTNRELQSRLEDVGMSREQLEEALERKERECRALEQNIHELMENSREPRRRPDAPPRTKATRLGYAARTVRPDARRRSHHRRGSQGHTGDRGRGVEHAAGPPPAPATERAGFEPATHLSARTRFPVALLRPLGHLSPSGSRVASADERGRFARRRAPLPPRPRTARPRAASRRT